MVRFLFSLLHQFSEPPRKPGIVPIRPCFLAKGEVLVYASRAGYGQNENV